MTLNAPVTVTAAVPPSAPVFSVRLGSVTALVVLKFNVPPLTVTGASVPEAASPLTLSTPLLTFRAAPVAAIPSRLLAFTVAPETASVPKPVMLVPAPRLRVPPEKLSVVPVSTS